MLAALVCACRAKKAKEDPAPAPSLRSIDASATPVDAPNDQGFDRLQRVAKVAGVTVETASAAALAAQSSICTGQKLGTEHEEVIVGGCYECELAWPVDVEPDAFDGVASAIEILPASLVAFAKLRTLRVCRKLEHLFGPKEPSGGTIDPKTGTIYIVLDQRDYRASREIFFHELYHLVDYAIDRDHVVHDREWEAINPEETHYGTTHRLLDGFVSRYAQTAVWEDKASTFAYALAYPDVVCGRFAKDAVVQAKGALLVERVRRAIGPRDALFFEMNAPCLHR